MTAEELAGVLRDHGEWLAGRGGKRADLRGADLRGADLRGADLRGANLYGANLYGATVPPLVAAQLEILPREGEVIGWKSLSFGQIAKLRIPAEARRSNATGRKCRAEHAEVVEIYGADGAAKPPGHVAISRHDGSFIYTKGATVRPTNGWGEDRWEECAPGIHFFLTREEAEAY